MNYTLAVDALIWPIIILAILLLYRGKISSIVEDLAIRAKASRDGRLRLIRIDVVHDSARAGIDRSFYATPMSASRSDCRMASCRESRPTPIGSFICSEEEVTHLICLCCQKNSRVRQLPFALVFR